MKPLLLFLFFVTGALAGVLGHYWSPGAFLIGLVMGAVSVLVESGRRA